MGVLLLGGTGEARSLARRLVDGGATVTSSLAGRVTDPALPVGDVRIGGFGGVAGLVAYLRETAPTMVVDATHPFAATITAHAVAACAETGTPLLLLQRPGWVERDEDNWIRLPSVAAAAGYARRSPPGTVFLTTGRRDLAAFAADDSHAYLVRAVDPPDVPLPPRTTLLLDRGPYAFAREHALMREHEVSLLVTKDSGGTMTVAKLDAARDLRMPVVVVDRPPLPTGVDIADSVEAALSRVRGTGAA